VVHAAPDLESVDVRAGDVAFTGVEYRTVTPYRAIDEFRPQFTVVPAGQPGAEALAENAEMVLDGEYYTVIAMPGENEERLVLTAIRDEEGPGDSTRSRIRVVNAVPGMDDLTVTVEGLHPSTARADTPAADTAAADTTLADDNGDRDLPRIENLGFRDEASEDVHAGTATLVVKSGESEQELLRVPDVRLEPGRSVTIVLVRGQGAQQLDALTVMDERPARHTADR
jgi:hypothetical protein